MQKRLKHLTKVSLLRLPSDEPCWKSISFFCFGSAYQAWFIRTFSCRTTRAAPLNMAHGLGDIKLRA